MENILFILVLLALGKALQRLKQFPPNSAHVLNLFVIYVSLPALILVQVPKLAFSRELLIPSIMPWVLLPLSAALVLGVSRLLRWERSTTGALLLVVPLGNTSFLGIPMVNAFFGPEAVSYAIFYDQLGSFPGLVIYGSVILALYGGTGAVRVKDVVWRIVTFPSFPAFIAALLVRSIVIPAAINGMLETLAATLVPLAMVAVGFQLKLRLMPANLTPLGVGLAIKLVLAPLVAWGGCQLLGLSGEAARVAIFEAGMSPMITAGAMALSVGLAPELAAGMVGFGVLASFITLPLLFQIL